MQRKTCCEAQKPDKIWIFGYDNYIQSNKIWSLGSQIFVCKFDYHCFTCLN